MESNIHSNFIPHDAPTASRPRRGAMFDVFGLLAIVLFVASATLATGVFLYVQYLQTSAQSKVSQLQRAKDAFEPTLIQELTRLDDRMRAADEVLGGHLAPSALFSMLEQLTLQSVAYNSLSFKASTDEITLGMQGTALTMNAIALQADLLAKSGAMSSPIFSNINRQVGGVRFDFESKLQPTAIRYRDIINGLSQQPEVQATPEPQQPASPFGEAPPVAPQQ